MKRVAVIALVCYLAYILEFLLYNFWGPWLKPEFLLLAVIFFNLYLGIRFSILAAIIAGLLKDASGVAPFGTYVLVYMAASYLTTLVRRYVYQPGSRFSRAVVTALVIVGCFIVQAVLTNMDREVRPGDLLLYLFVPQLLTTMIAATYVYEQLRRISVFFVLKSV